MPNLPTSDLESLCENVPLGRLGLRFLTIDIAFCHRDVEEWDTVEAELAPQSAADQSFTLKGGVFLELSVQTRVSWPLPWGKAHRLLPARAYQFVQGLGGPSDDPAWLDGLSPRVGVTAHDLTRLTEISGVYNHNVRLNQETGKLRALFIPRSVEAEIREIATRLCRSRGYW